MSLVGNTPFLYLKKANGIFVLFVLLTTVACYRKEKEIYPKMEVWKTGIGIESKDK